MNKSAVALDILEKALSLVPFEGWSEQVLMRAAAEAGVNSGEWRRVFPCGVADALEAWARTADCAMLAKAEAIDVNALKIRERIAALVMLRLDYLWPHREALRKAFGFYAIPMHGRAGIASLFRTVNAMWYAAGDKSVDWNWYSKRVLLAGVYTATQLYWLDDESANQQATRDFLARRIEDVMKIEGLKKKFGLKRAA